MAPPAPDLGLLPPELRDSTSTGQGCPVCGTASQPLCHSMGKQVQHSTQWCVQPAWGHLLLLILFPLFRVTWLGSADCKCLGFTQGQHSQPPNSQTLIFQWPSVCLFCMGLYLSAPLFSVDAHLPVYLSSMGSTCLHTCSSRWPPPALWCRC
jgi:hypothetical protein